MPKSKRKLALSDSDSDRSDSALPALQPSSKAKGKSRKRSDTVTEEEDEVESVLVENSQAGLKTRSKDNGKNKSKAKDQGKAEDAAKGRGKGGPKEKDKPKSKDKKKSRELALSDNSEDDDDVEILDDDASIMTLSGGSLHGSDDEPGLSKWTTTDQQDWLDPPDEAEGGDYLVDIIIRWRWHPRLHFPQYRVKWEGYADYHNTWEHKECFDGDDVDSFWKDLEFEGTEQRPPKWDLTKERAIKMRKQEGKNVEEDGEDTDNAFLSTIPHVRKEARRKKRRAIRTDRIQMREAYRRKNLRERAEEKARIEAREKHAEERRRKRREEEEEAKRKTATLAPRKIITHGVKVTAGGASRPAAPSKVSTVNPVIPSNSRQTANTRDPFAYAKAFLPESDAKIKAERRKVLETGKVKSAANAGDSSKQTSFNLDGAKAEAQINSEVSPTRLGSSTATRGSGKPRGAFRGAHKNIRKMVAWDPLGSLGERSQSTATARPTPQAAPSSHVSSYQQAHSTSVSAPIGRDPPPPPLPSNGWDDDPEPMVEQVPTATTEISMLAASTFAPVAVPVPVSAPRPAVSQAPGPAPLPPPLIRGAIHMGYDPRSRAAHPPSAPTSAATIGGSVSPFGIPANASPLHPAQSPIHPTQSSREGRSGLISPLIEQRENALTAAERDRATQAMTRWRMDSSLQERIGRSYNVICFHQSADKEQRRVLDNVIRYNGGGLINGIEAKHKEPQRRNIVWMPNARVNLTSVEKEALVLPNFRFFQYENDSLKEIWPYDKGKVIMYTFGALMIKLIEQIFDRKETHPWTVEKGSTIFVHPWQKAILQQLIDLDRVDDFLRQVLGITADVPDKGFDLVESGLSILDEFEEVPSELTNSYLQSSDAPSAFDIDLERLTLTIDNEVNHSLSRLQYEWKLERRSFKLVMAKTRLSSREISTLYEIMSF